MNDTLAKLIETKYSDFPNYIKNFKAICDSEGFYQHSGQCWNDAVQMFLLSADGYKEFFQALFTYNSNSDFLKDYIDMTFMIKELDKRSVILKYFKAVQQRFLRHYRTEKDRIKLHKNITIQQAKISSSNNQTCSVSDKLSVDKLLASLKILPHIPGARSIRNKKNSLNVEPILANGPKIERISYNMINSLKRRNKSKTGATRDELQTLLSYYLELLKTQYTQIDPMIDNIIVSNNPILEFDNAE